MEVVVGIQPDDMMTTFANNPGAADKWVKENVIPWTPQVNIKAISVANERLQDTTGDVANHVVDGMWALYYALKSHGLEGKIKIMTPQQPSFLRNTIPPPAPWYAMPSTNRCPASWTSSPRPAPPFSSPPTPFSTEIQPQNGP